MILIDYSNFCLVSIFGVCKEEKTIDEKMIRHVVLNQIRILRQKFEKRYGKVVICLDGDKIWRKEYFPYYKIKRKKARDDSGWDWPLIYQTMKTLSDELYNELGYTSCFVSSAEADDVIAVLVKSSNDPHLIVSSDKDFKQLQSSPNIKQYSPMTGAMVVCDEPEEFHLNQILAGDSDDGVPNILSDSDTFAVSGKRQKPLTKKRIEELLEGSSYKSHENYERNKTLVSLNEIPDHVKNQILQEFKNSSPTRGDVFKYTIKHNLRILSEHIGEF